MGKPQTTAVTVPFTDWMPFLSPDQQHQSTEGSKQAPLPIMFMATEKKHNDLHLQVRFQKKITD